MLLIKIISVILICKFAQGNSLLEVTDKNQVNSFVKKVIGGLNSRETATYDVALLHFYDKEKQKVEDIVVDLLMAIPKENIVITPKLTEKVTTRDARNAAVIIIVSDVTDQVS